MRSPSAWARLFRAYGAGASWELCFARVKCLQKQRQGPSAPACPMKKALACGVRDDDFILRMVCLFPICSSVFFVALFRVCVLVLFQSYPCVGTHFALALSRIRSRGRSRNGYRSEEAVDRDKKRWWGTKKKHLAGKNKTSLSMECAARDGGGTGSGENSSNRYGGGKSVGIPPLAVASFRRSGFGRDDRMKGFRIP